MASPSTNNKPLYYAAFATFFVFAFPLLVQVSFSDFVREGEYNSRLGWTLIILFLGLMHQKQWLHYVLLLPFAIGGSIDIGYAISFGGVFTTATIEAVMQTDSSEASEYLTAYSSPILLFILAVYWFLAIYLLRRINLNIGHSRTRSTFVTLGVILVVAAGYRVSVMQRFHDTIPGVIGSIPSYYKGSMDVQSEIDSRAAVVEKATSQNEKASVLNGNLSQTYVFLIGESVNRNHMGLYGYHRNTTPKLQEMKEELNVFTDVISSHAQTNASLRLALTQANQQNKMSSFDALSVIDLANMAGFKTWWISNQQPLRRTMTAVASQADVANFISNDYQGVAVRRFDHFMLPYIDDALNDQASKKAIFIHAMGSHAQYRNRYPESFEVFTDTDVKAYTAAPSARQIDAINSYDNSILYTDNFAYNIIESLRISESEIKAFTLISDHGEEVFDKINVKGHSPDNVTANMVEIPFINWVNSGYRNHRKDITSSLGKNLELPFRLDDFYHYAGELMGISSQFNHSDKSLIGSKFSPLESRQIYRFVYETELNYRHKAPDQVADRK